MADAASGEGKTTKFDKDCEIASRNGKQADTVGLELRHQRLSFAHIFSVQLLFNKHHLHFYFFVFICLYFDLYFDLLPRRCGTLTY